MPAVLCLTWLVPLPAASVCRCSLHPVVIARQCCQVLRRPLGSERARISAALFYVGGAFVDSVGVPQVG